MPPARRRNQQQNEEDEELLESLLPEEYGAGAGDLQDPAGKFVETGDIPRNVLVALMMESWKCFLACLAFLVGHPLASSVTSIVQEARLRDLQRRICVPYRDGDTEHLESLKELWSAAFPDDVWCGAKNPRWKDMGWQGEDPGTDFRGGGYLSLANLLYMAHNREPLFKQLMNKTEGKRADWEYPFAAAGINVTVYLIDSLKLRDDRPSNSAHARGFQKLLETSDCAFEELYCCTFELLDKTWLEMHASYMQFPEVIRKTMTKVEKVLSKGPEDFCELKRCLSDV